MIFISVVNSIIQVYVNALFILRFIRGVRVVHDAHSKCDVIIQFQCQR